MKRITINRIEGKDVETALALAWNVFLQFVAPEYSQEGVEEFKEFVEKDWKTSCLTFFGAYTKREMVGMIAIRPATHISLFFVSANCQGKGVGRKLFEALRREYPEGKMTVNSSPCAVEIYKRLGFLPTASEQLTNGIRYTPMELG